MWAHAIAKRIPAKSRVGRSSGILGSTNPWEDRKYFAWDANNGDDKKPDVNPRRRNNNNQYHKQRDPSNRKQNFDRKFANPASKGQLLKNRSSAIPRLSARKSKPSLEPIRGRSQQSVMMDDGLDDEWLSDLDKGRPQNADDDIFGQKQEEPEDDYYDISLIDEDKYFWTEEEVENIIEPIDEAMLPPEGKELEFEYLESERNPTRGEQDDSHIGLDDGGPFYDSDEDDDQGRPKFERRVVDDDFEEPMSGDPEENFFVNQFDLTTAVALPEELFKDDPLPDPDIKVMPLQTQGPGLDHFIEAMTYHPAEYARLECKFEHPDSKREAKPLFGKDRVHPPLEFVEQFKRFLYVTGFPTLTVNGEQGDLDNVIHFKMLQTQVTERTGVDTSQVYPVNLTSAFVGYNSPRELAAAIQQGPSGSPVAAPIVRAFQPEDAVDSDFVKDVDPDRVLKISNLPAGHSSASLRESLFPDDTEFGAVYAPLVQADDIRFLSKTSALIRLQTKEQAESLAGSDLLNELLHGELGTYHIQYFRARRELVHRCFGGPAKRHELRQQGPRLVVDSEMPPKNFYISHVRTIQITNVDPKLTKEEISAFFQPYCGVRRDVRGSISRVRCAASGLPNGQIFVGFEYPGEAEACIRASNGRFLLGQRMAVARLVHDRKVPHQNSITNVMAGRVAPAEQRSLRTEAELLNDLNNWERFVEDPQDIQDILASGITKDILDEVMRGFRYKNPTFGPLDSGLRSEALQPERERGSMYRETVQLYIKTLKECLPSKENPGEIYELMHGPDEPLDLSIFDDEEERKAMLKKRRSNPAL